jgi:hypothetical protein
MAISFPGWHRFVICGRIWPIWFWISQIMDYGSLYAYCFALWFYGRSKELNCSLFSGVWWPTGDNWCHSYFSPLTTMTRIIALLSLVSVFLGAMNGESAAPETPDIRSILASVVRMMMTHQHSQSTPFILNPTNWIIAASRVWHESSGNITAKSASWRDDGKIMVGCQG